MSDFRFVQLGSWIISCLLGLSSCKTLTMENPKNNSGIVYQKAYSIAKDSLLHLSKNGKKIGLFVKKEVVSFGNYAQFFQNELTENYYFSRQELLFDSLLVAKVRSLTKIGDKQKESTSILFFSEFKKGYFFAELFLDSKPTHFSFAERPAFGKSLMFLFKIKNEEVHCVKFSELFYN